MTTRKLNSKSIKIDSGAYIGKDGDIWIDTESNLMKISDGVTPGGVVITTDGAGIANVAWADITDINNAAGPVNVAIGNSAGNDTQGEYAVAVGDQAGSVTQGSSAVAIGESAGRTGQGESAVAIGEEAGRETQGVNAVAIGSGAGYHEQLQEATAVGYRAGQRDQGTDATAVGSWAGNETQGDSAVAVGNSAGKDTQGIDAVAVGKDSGNTAQGESAVAIGKEAGRISQGEKSIALGSFAGMTTQGEYATAIGYDAGKTNQSDNAVAVGYGAGLTNQGDQSVAIGKEAGYTDQAANSIVINATGSILNNIVEDTFVVKPIASAVGATMLMYDATSGQVTHTATPLITGDLTVEEGFSFTPTRKYFEVETGAGNDRIMRSGINMSTFGQTIAPKIDLTSYRASPADGDEGPRLTFRASTAGSANSIIANIETKVIATASGAETTKVSISTEDAGTYVTPFTITGNTVYSASHISIADLKILVAAANDFDAYKNLIDAL